MSPVVRALGAVKFKIMALWGMWRSVECGAWSVERGAAKIEIDAGDLPRAGQCRGVCVDRGCEDGTSLHWVWISRVRSVMSVPQCTNLLYLVSSHWVLCLLRNMATRHWIQFTTLFTKSVHYSHVAHSMSHPFMIRVKVKNGRTRVLGQ